MARTINDIYNSLLAEKAKRPELADLNSTSQVAIYNGILFIVAVCQWTLENLWDLFTSETNEKIKNQRQGKIPFYRALAFEFRNGQNLNVNDQYDDTGLTASQIDAMKIVKYASVTDIDGKLRMKVATQLNSKPYQLTPDQLLSFSNYVERLKFAGVKIIKDSLPADKLRLELDIWYNPLVLRSDGSRIDVSADTPVKDAINAYLNLLPFNGEYSNTRLVDYLQKVDGVELPVIKVAQTQYGLFPFVSVDEKYIPDAGYLQIDDTDLVINYREYV